MELSGTTVTFGIALLSTLILAIIVGYKEYIRVISKNLSIGQTGNTVLERKYAKVNTFSQKNTFTKVGLLVAFATSFMAFSYTTYEPQQLSTLVDFSRDDELTSIVEITIAPPQAKFPKPPPPPPPPVLEIKMVDDLVEEPEYKDQTIDEHTSLSDETELSDYEGDDWDDGETGYEEPEIELKPKVKTKEIKEFLVVKQMPRFSNCEDKSCSDAKLLEYIYKNIKYPSMAREQGIEGTVNVSFVVDEHGDVIKIQVLRGPGGGCGKEVARVIGLMNGMSSKWIPGKQRGKAVRVKFNIPVNFRLK